MKNADAYAEYAQRWTVIGARFNAQFLTGSGAHETREGPDFPRVASIVDRHQKGAPLQNIPVQWDQTPRLMINQTTASALQVKIPETLLNEAILVK